MYRTAAPARPTTTCLRLGKVLHREFPAGEHRIDVPELYRYFADLTRDHGIGHEQEDVDRARGNTFTSMAHALLDDELSADEPIDLAIVAHATPDFDPRLSAAVSLTAVLPGGPLVFSLSGQGSSVAFTALRVAAAHARRHGSRRVLVLVADQTGMPYESDRPVRDAAVALLLEAGERGFDLRTRPGVAPEAVPEALAALLAEFPEPATVIAGRGVGPLAGAREVAPGFPATGLWAALAEQGLASPVLLADHDPVHLDLNVCVVTGAGSPVL
ncbi:hypothetical protein [Amycolatopsis magusensis]|uniref:Uncharacterized protein n=1 Tax=Amycolatopsis magusensis TaxID=882444 RepID=A0ABS4Q190_9PSEU|nr:hypothetical protein [Amycolatopsis magusensis]MBP2184910.1 hypothetical protein [Amycolatopsis magusensis]